MTTHVIDTAQWGGAHYGYGLTMAEIDGHDYLGHGGSTPGFVSTIIGDMTDGLGVVVLINGYVESYGAFGIAAHVLELLRAGLHSEELPRPPAAADPALIDNAADYAGRFTDGQRTLELSDQGGRLLLGYDGGEIAVERRGVDSFYVGHPEWEHFLLEFGRGGSNVVEAFHGPCCYIRDGYSSPLKFDCPEEWQRYPGHYRAYNPGLTNFRIVLRKGGLMLVSPTGGKETLTPLGDGLFRIGNDPRSPETLRFDSVSEGKTLRADYSGCPYYRVPAP